MSELNQLVPELESHTTEGKALGETLHMGRRAATRADPANGRQYHSIQIRYWEERGRAGAPPTQSDRVVSMSYGAAHLAGRPGTA